MRRPLTRYDWIVARVSHQGEHCLIWPFGLTDGYPTCTVPEGGARRGHRLMCELAHGKPPTPKHHAAHSCGHSRCVNPNHLSWKTNGENQIDRRDHGTMGKGPGGRHRLTTEKVAEIRALKGQKTEAELAEMFGTTKKNIHFVLAGKTWRSTMRVFTDEEVRTIRGAQGTHIAVAKRFGGHPAAIARIRNGESYTHVADLHHLTESL